MPIQITCDACGSSYKVPDRRAGERGKCKCGNVIPIPDAQPLPPPEPIQSAPSEDGVSSAEFKGVRISDASEAARMLFEEALPNIPAQEPKWVEIAYRSIAAKWGSSQLFEGTAQEIRKGVLQNLRRIAREPGFDDFMVYTITDPTIPGHLKSIQVNAFFRNAGAFVPVRIWKTADKLYACGNSLFAM